MGVQQGGDPGRIWRVTAASALTAVQDVFHDGAVPDGQVINRDLVAEGRRVGVQLADHGEQLLWTGRCVTRSLQVGVERDRVATGDRQQAAVVAGSGGDHEAQPALVA
jgi:hypothetical protein